MDEEIQVMDCKNIALEMWKNRTLILKQKRDCTATLLCFWVWFFSFLTSVQVLRSQNSHNSCSEFTAKQLDSMWSFEWFSVFIINSNKKNFTTGNQLFILNWKKHDFVFLRRSNFYLKFSSVTF